MATLIAEAGGRGKGWRSQVLLLRVELEAAVDDPLLARPEAARPPPAVRDHHCQGLLAGGAVPGFEQAVVVLASADGDPEMAGEAHGRAVPHQDPRLEERRPE